MAPVKPPRFTAAKMAEWARLAEAERVTTPTATAVTYDRVSRCYTLTMLARAKVVLAADAIRELVGYDDETHSSVELSPSGKGLRWPSTDMDISVTGLIMDFIAGEGWKSGYRRMLMSELPKMKSPAKAKAARENGRKGGRPPKAKAAKVAEEATPT